MKLVRMYGKLTFSPIGMQRIVPLVSSNVVFETLRRVLYGGMASLLRVVLLYGTVSSEGC